MFKKLILILIILSFIIFLTPWFQRIFESNKIIAAIIYLESFGLSLYLTNIFKKFAIATTIGLLLLSLFLTTTQIDKSLIKHSNLELAYITQRQTYYPHNIGRFLHNNITLSIFKYQRNFFTNLDFNQFFFGGAPRFRPYGLDFDKFPTFYLPFFLYGLFKFLTSRVKLKYPFIFITIFFLIVAFSNPSFILGPYPLLPLIIGFVCLGFYDFLIILPKIMKGKRNDK